MGTRSLTIFKDEDKEICVMYRQFDGYPDGHGLELAEFLSGITMVNGYSTDEKRKVANGMGCLTAQVIAEFKKGVGGFYIHSAGTRDCWEDYIYIVEGKEGKEPTIELSDSSNECLFKGSASAYLIWLNENKVEE